MTVFRQDHEIDQLKQQRDRMGIVAAGASLVALGALGCAVKSSGRCSIM